MFREPLLLAFHRNDKLAAVKSIGPQQVKSRRLILLSSAADLARDKILANLQAWGYRPEKTLEVTNLAQAFDFVANGDGIAAVRASVGRFEPKGIVLRSLAGLPMLDVGLAYRRDIRSPLVRNLLQVAREVFAQERERMMQSTQKP